MNQHAAATDSAFDDALVLELADCAGHGGLGDAETLGDLVLADVYGAAGFLAGGEDVEDVAGGRAQPGVRQVFPDLRVVEAGDGVHEDDLVSGAGGITILWAFSVAAPILRSRAWCLVLLNR